MIETGRYSIRYGRFGAYFYDNKEQKELDLDQVLMLLPFNDKPRADLCNDKTVFTEETDPERIAKVKALMDKPAPWDGKTVEVLKAVKADILLAVEHEDICYLKKALHALDALIEGK